jgi:hypothetical protein
MSLNDQTSTQMGIWCTLDFSYVPFVAAFGHASMLKATEYIVWSPVHVKNVTGKPSHNQYQLVSSHTESVLAEPTLI